MEAAITPNTKLLVSESPTNPHMSVVDLERFAEIGRRHEVETLIDATLATPYNLRPIEAGVDYVLHSVTKYLAGHNDLLAGVVAGCQEQLEPVRNLRGIMGAVNSPQNCYLLLARPEDVRAADAAAQRKRPARRRVSRVAIRGSKKCTTPGSSRTRITSSPAEQMRGFGGLVTFLVKDADWRATADVVDAVRIPRIAPSLGGVESLIEQPLVMSYYQSRRKNGPIRHPRQHDPPRLRHRECRRPDRRSGPGAGSNGARR